MDHTLKENKANTGKNPVKLSADTGYFSGPNLEQLKNEMIDGYVCPEKKVGDFDKTNFKYDSERNVYICPNHRELRCICKPKPKADGTVSDSLYSGDCTGCPLQNKCTNSKTGNRTVKRDPYDSLREEMRLKLQTEVGKEIYSHRKELPEPVFGQIKQQQAFHQHLRRGLNNANIEFGLACLVYNIKRIWHKYVNYQGAKDALNGIPG